ncbi:cell division cycle protein [Phakopsora pachyrhizi]|uniref:Cell division cycle protein n=1 Tax=Phakopsora pachyrhizi TaxID=170000 RepID=A0AAV0BQ47_PHAPC|nr:cell division cycle protein [Phakopsora pachyrhizi]CAH7688306.1 cell division cycle protein [Phakopsora pachyrhizi]
MSTRPSPTLSPPRKRFRNIENIDSPGCNNPKSRSHPQTIGKTLSSLCDKLAVEEVINHSTPNDVNSFNGFPNVFAHARHLLKLGSTSDFVQEGILGRQKEMDKVQSFFATRFSWNLETAHPKQSLPLSKNPGSLYISGPPGTGKTHLMNSVLLNPNNEVCRKLRDLGIRVKFINCVSLAGSTGSKLLDQELWKKILDCLGDASDSLPTRTKATNMASQVEKSVMGENCSPCVIVLDEIDYLASSKMPLITSLFSLSKRAPKANFTVVGIANALDLTTRFTLKTYRSEYDPEPDLIHFSPFESNDMIDIVRQRLKHLCQSYQRCVFSQNLASPPALKLFTDPSLEPTTPSLNPLENKSSVPLFHPAALQLCAKKVSSVTGDLRTFLSILRKLLELAELNAVRNSEFLLKNTSGGQKSVLDTPTKMRKFTRIISTSQLAPDLANGRNSDNDWLNSRVKDPCAHYTPLTAPKVSPGEVIKYLKCSGILDQPSFNASESECSKKLQDLNLQQALVLVCLCVGWSREAEDENFTNDYTIGRGRAYEVYCDCLRPKDDYRLSSSRHANLFNIGIKPVSESEWTDLLESGLQSRGLVNLQSQLRSGASSVSATPTKKFGTSPTKIANSSPLKSPSKSRHVFFQRSLLSTPTKPKSTMFNSPLNSMNTLSPSQSRSKYDVDQILPVHSISILIKCIQSLAQPCGNDYENVDIANSNGLEGKPQFSKEIISLLNQLLIVEEKRMRKSKKRKLGSGIDLISNTLVNPIGSMKRTLRDEDDENDEEAVIKERMVREIDEGSCRD